MCLKVPTQSPRWPLSRGVLRFQSAAHIHIPKPLLLCLYMHLYKGINGREQSQCTKELLSETRALNGSFPDKLGNTSAASMLVKLNFSVCHLLFSTRTEGKIEWLCMLCNNVQSIALLDWRSSGTERNNEEVGEDNFFLFGDELIEIDATKMSDVRGQWKTSQQVRSKQFVPDPLLEEVKEYIEDQDPNEDRIVKGKEIDDEDLSKPFKETLKTPFTRRIIEFSGPEYSMPTNIALYDGSTDPADHLNRFVGAANSGEWPMPVWCRMFQQTLDGSARGWFESLSPNSIDEWWRLREAFTTRYSTRKACYKEPHEITKIVMKISSFMDSVKSPELAKRFAKCAKRDGRDYGGTAKEILRFERATIGIPTRSETTSIRKGTEITELCTTKGSEQTDPYRGWKGDRIEETLHGAEGNYMVNLHSSKRRKKRKDRRKAMEYWMNNSIFPAIMADDASDEPLIIEAEVEGYLVRRVYVDEGSSVEVMFEHCFENLPEKVKAGLRETRTDLVGFAGEVAKPLGKIDLEVCFGNEGLSRRTLMKFIIIRAPSPYNIILGRPGLKILHAIPSTIHSMIKFPTPKGIATLIRISNNHIAECRLS
ncbi:reverse transcriptase domain-containing protein [Tanacetum coccineum]